MSSPVEKPATSIPEAAKLVMTPPVSGFTPYQKFVVAVLAFLQFTIILDFMILSPLGAILMPELKITPSQFGMVVSAYAFSAGASGLLASGFADRYDRKRLLLFFYTGFVLGTLLCAVADTYLFLMGARIVTGLFGGVIGSIVMAITTDLFPMEKRGRVMGFIQTAFAASQVLGIPLGLLLANQWGWHTPFLMIVGVSVAVGLVIIKYLRPIDGHLSAQTRRSPYQHIVGVFSNPAYLRGFATTALLATGGFMLMPFGSAFSVHNLGIQLEKLPMVYLITGLCSILIGPLVGRLSDAYGKFKTFALGTAISIVMVTIYTHLGTTPLATVILVNVIMFIGIFSRMIPSQALMSAVPSLESRGAFMSVSASIQQVSGGCAAILAGYLVSEGPGGELIHFEHVGYAVSASSLFSLFMMYQINRAILKKQELARGAAVEAAPAGLGH